MLITVLGCGTSTGVPLIHCSCRVCRSKNPKNKRLRSSVWVQVGGKSLLIDASPDLRQQAMLSKISRIDAVLFTHPHADHVGGVDELRSFNFVQKESIPAFGHDWTVRELPRRFPYIFSSESEYKKNEGGGVAKIDLHEFSLKENSFQAAGIKIIPIEVIHGSEKVAAFRIKNFAYITDCTHIPDESMKKLKGLDVLILDCLRLASHDTHLHFDAAMEYSLKIGAKKTVFTHMGHDFDYDSFSKKLPKKHFLAYDKMKLRMES